mmetsp:Transcript_65347/g.168204  ORF Transcript_65347/g.168204 Transcript_65347/m.168204 type:complete len:206 (-) Transcript_65347:790-1407(-)
MQLCGATQVPLGERGAFTPGMLHHRCENYMFGFFSDFVTRCCHTSGMGVRLTSWSPCSPRSRGGQRGRPRPRRRLRWCAAVRLRRRGFSGSSLLPSWPTPKWSRSRAAAGCGQEGPKRGTSLRSTPTWPRRVMVSRRSTRARTTAATRTGTTWRSECGSACKRKSGLARLKCEMGSWPPRWRPSRTTSVTRRSSDGLSKRPGGSL